MVDVFQLLGAPNETFTKQSMIEVIELETEIANVRIFIYFVKTQGEQIFYPKRSAIVFYKNILRNVKFYKSLVKLK